MPPRALAAPLHRHNREDEYSFILEGRMGALLGDDVVEAGPGDLVYEPRGQWHTYGNAGDEPARSLEIITPAGFEQFFAELAPLSAGGGPYRTPLGEHGARTDSDVDSTCARPERITRPLRRCEFPCPCRRSARAP